MSFEPELEGKEREMGTREMLKLMSKEVRAEVLGDYSPKENI